MMRSSTRRKEQSSKARGGGVIIIESYHLELVYIVEGRFGSVTMYACM